MIRINLLPAEEAQRVAGKRQELAVGALVLGVAVIGFVVVHGWQQARISMTQRELSGVNQELVAIHGPYVEISRMERQRNELKEKLAVIETLKTKSGGPVRVLADLSTATPDKLWLKEFAETGGQVRLSGFGVDEQTVADFLRRLGKSAYFREIDLEETSQVDEDGAKRKRFVIRGQVDYLGGRATGKTDGAADGDAAGSADSRAAR